MSPRRSTADVERTLDEMADDGTLNALAMHLAIEDGNDWPSMTGEERDAWNERAIARVRQEHAAPRQTRRRRTVTRESVATAAVADFEKATPHAGRLIVGRTRKGDAIAVAPVIGEPVTRDVLRSMFIEARDAGLDGKLYVYGSHTTMSEAGRFRFRQIDPRTGRKL